MIFAPTQLKPVHHEANLQLNYQTAIVCQPALDFFLIFFEGRRTKKSDELSDSLLLLQKITRNHVIFWI